MERQKMGGKNNLVIRGLGDEEEATKPTVENILKDMQSKVGALNKK